MSDVHAVVFVVSLSSYNEQMFENKDKNCMVDALELFGKTVNDEHFINSAVIVFFNKRDLFEEKIQKLPITTSPAFADFDREDPCSFMDTTEFVKFKFLAQNRNQNRTIYTHICCAL